MMHLSRLLVALALAFLPAALARGEAKLPSPQKSAERKAGLKSTSPLVKQAAGQIDKLVAEDLASKGLRPARLTTDEEFVRRVYLDITGAIPTMEQTQAFLISKDALRRQKLIDHLLDTPAYVSHMYNYWADQFRITARTRGDYAGHFPDWVKQAIRDNKPFDKFVFELVTADGKSRDNGAVGYWLRDQGMVLEITATTTQIFLGTQIGCAQCHDHPFDIWEQKDFYEFAAFTAEVQTRDRALGGKFREVQRMMYDGSELKVSRDVYQIVRNLLREEGYLVHDASNRSLRLPGDYKYDNGKPGERVSPNTLFGDDPQARKGEELRQRFARWLTGPDNKLFTKVIANRMWARIMGMGIVEPVDDFNPENKPSNEKLLDYLENMMRGMHYDVKEYLRIVLNTDTYQRASDREDYTHENFANQAGLLRRMTAEQIWDSFATLTVDDLDERSGPGGADYGMMMGMSAGDDVDLSKMSAKQIIAYGEDLARQRNEARARLRDRARQRARDQFMPQIVRASEVRQPAPPGHFLRDFGASARETSNDAHTDPSVPQVLNLLNGQGMRLVMDRRSVLAQNLAAANTEKDKADTLYLTILSRYPSPTERAIAIGEIKENGENGVANLVWALLNTREFIFIR